MSITEWESLLGWSAASNYLLLFIWFICFSQFRESLYRMHSQWFALRPETFDAVHYAAMAAYKLLIFFFALIPYLYFRLAA